MTRTLLVSAVVVGVWVAGGSIVVRAQGPVPSGVNHEVRGQIGASINNAGLQNTIEFAWIKPTSGSDHPLLSGAHVAAGITNVLTPTQVKFGGWVEYSPLSILDVRAGIDPSGYFGTFDSLMGFGSYDEPFDPDSRKTRGGAGAGAAGRVYLSPTLKFKAGRILGSTGATVEWWRSSAGQPYFYEPTRDTVLRSNGDRLLTTTSVLMYQWVSGSAPLAIGAIHTLARVDDARGNRIQKLGAIAVKEFGASRFRLPHPSLTMVIARYLDDPFKKDEWSAAMAIGFRR